MIDCFHTNVDIHCLLVGRALDVLGGPGLATINFIREGAGLDCMICRVLFH